MSERRRFAVVLAPLAAVIFLAVLTVSVLTRGPEPASALPPFVEDAVGAFGGSLDYGVAAAATPSVPASAAIASARQFTDAATRAVVHSTGLALYSDLKDKNVLVWVVDIDGLRMPAIGGGFPAGRAAPSRTFTRAVVLVSATQPDFVVAMFTSGPPDK